MKYGTCFIHRERVPLFREHLLPGENDVPYNVTDLSEYLLLTGRYFNIILQIVFSISSVCKRARVCVVSGRPLE